MPKLLRSDAHAPTSALRFVARNLNKLHHSTQVLALDSMFFAIRRIVGKSMQPAYDVDDLVLASGVFWKLDPGDVVVISHNGLEKIKRIKSLTEDQIWLEGDNSSHSTDSRQFGAISRNLIVGKVIRKL